VTYRKKPITTLLLLVLVIAICACEDGEENNAETILDGRGGGYICFISDRDGNYEIYIANADGSAVTRVTSTAYFEHMVRWSPDGTKIAYAIDHEGYVGLEYLDVININRGEFGSPVTVITQNHNVNVLDFDWMPNGQGFVFNGVADLHDQYAGISNIYLVDIDGTNLQQITTTNDSRDPSCAPNGQSIVYSKVIIPQSLFHLYSMNVQGGNVQMLLDHNCSYPAWSPDGTRIVGSYEVSPASHHLFLINPDGSGLTILPSQSSYTSNPRWSPDGGRIVFAYNSGNAVGLAIINVDGTNWTTIVSSTSSNNFAPDWRPAIN
jgi:TolB protein